MLGSLRVIACPRCGSRVAHRVLACGNLRGEVRWSDGESYFPMLPLPPPVLKCPACGRCYWIEDAPEVALLPRGGAARGGGAVEPSRLLGWMGRRRQRAPEPVSEEVPGLTAAGEEDLYAALEGGLAADEEQEKRLRLLAWRRWNDPFRPWPPSEEDGAAVARRRARFHPPASGGATEANLLRLEATLRIEDEPERLLLAEVMRELGHFTEAKDLLGGPWSADCGRDAWRMHSLCRARDRRVCLL